LWLAVGLRVGLLQMVSGLSFANGWWVELCRWLLAWFSRQLQVRRVGGCNWSQEMVSGWALQMASDLAY
jgi:hypothetical protein